MVTVVLTLPACWHLHLDFAVPIPMPFRDEFAWQARHSVSPPPGWAAGAVRGVAGGSRERRSAVTGRGRLISGPGSGLVAPRFPSWQCQRLAAQLTDWLEAWWLPREISHRLRIE
jgi:hypothetical protein